MLPKTLPQNASMESAAADKLLAREVPTKPCGPHLAVMSTTTRVTHTSILFCAFLGFGMCRGVFGPTLLELRLITDMPLTKISLIFTCFGVGGIVGSLIFGRLFDMFNPLKLLVCILMSVAFITALIPWLQMLALMMGACALHSFLLTGIAIGCTVTIFRLWCKFSRQIFLSMHLVYTIGGFIAPLLCEPFLTHRTTLNDNATQAMLFMHSQQPANLSSTPYINLNMTHTISARENTGFTKPAFFNKTDTAQSFLNISVIGNFTNISNHGIVHGFAQGQRQHLPRSKIVFTYLIIGIYLLTVSVAMLLLAIFMHKNNKEIYWKGTQSRGVLHCQTSVFTLLATILFMFFNFNFGGQDTGYAGLLFTFAVEYTGFTPTQGSFLMSMFYTANMIGRILSIIASHWVAKALYVLLCSITGCSVSCAILVYYTNTSISVVWVATVIAGLSLSSMYAMGLLWAKDFLPITANFTSLYTIAYICGLMLWPPLMSYQMKSQGPAWFAYVNVIMLVNLIIAMALLFTLHKCKVKF